MTPNTIYNPSPMEIKELKKEKNVAQVEVIVTKKEVDVEKNHAVEELAQQITVKGFRQGKAPKNIAEEHLNPEKVTDHVLNHLLSDAVSKALKEYKYNLLGRPVLESVDTKGKDEWKFSLNFPLYPEIDLGDYKKVAKGASKTTVKKTKTEKTTEDSEKAPNNEDSLNLIYQALLKNIQVDIPESVIEEEVNYSLERLSTQAQSLHLTLENYLKAVNRTLDQVKDEYRKSAVDSLKLDLILLDIAKKEGIQASQEEVENLAKSTNLPENQHSRLKMLIARRKTLELLSSL
ncbi:MAG: Trigger factor [Candidatus Collierbacteria bacterium GW2011_GWF2_44_15]|uniref:Trigger factor n=3 Tax=Candidatus Collieribacteriota TaxID=1752725 RepID=A0A0G1HHF9_9BACT|nr:MAG: Trigger factor [Candidatus Collierbacteria bacterium GW2011_GWF2_44_15]